MVTVMLCTLAMLLFHCCHMTWVLLWHDMVLLWFLVWHGCYQDNVLWFLLWHCCYYDIIVTMALLLQHRYYHGIVAMLLLLPWQSCYHDTLIAVIVLTLQSLWFCRYYDNLVTHPLPLSSWRCSHYDSVVIMTILLHTHCRCRHDAAVTMILSLLWHFCVTRLRRTCHCDSMVTMTLLCCQVEKDLSLWFCGYHDTSVLPGWEGPVTVILWLPWHFCVARLRRTCHCGSVVTLTLMCCQVKKDLSLWFCCYRDTSVLPGWEGPVTVVLWLPWHLCVAKLRRTCHCDSVAAVTLLCCQVDKDLSLWFCGYRDTSVLPGWEGSVTVILWLPWHFCVARLRRTCHCGSVVTMTLLCCQVEKDLSLWFCGYHDTSVLPGWEGPVTMILWLPWHFCVARLRRTCHYDSVVTVTLLCCQVEKDLSLWFCGYRNTSMLPGWEGPVTVILWLPWYFCVARLRRTCHYDSVVTVTLLCCQVKKDLSLWFCGYRDTSVLPGWEGPVTMILWLPWHFCVARLRRTCHYDSVVTVTLLCCQVKKDLSLWFCGYHDTSVLPGWEGPVTMILWLPWHFCVARLRRTCHYDSVVTMTLLCCQVEKDLSLWFCGYHDTSVLPGWEGPVTMILWLPWHFCVARLRRTYQMWVLVRHQCLN